MTVADNIATGKLRSETIRSEFARRPSRACRECSPKVAPIVRSWLGCRFEGGRPFPAVNGRRSRWRGTICASAHLLILASRRRRSMRGPSMRCSALCRFDQGQNVRLISHRFSTVKSRPNPRAGKRKDRRAGRAQSALRAAGVMRKCSNAGGAVPLSGGEWAEGMNLKFQI